MEKFAAAGVYLYKNKERYQVLADNQTYLNSPAFSCRGRVFDGIEPLDSPGAAAQMMIDMTSRRNDIASEKVMNTVDLLKLSIFIIDIQSEIDLRLGNAATSALRGGVEKAESMLASAASVKAALDQKSYYDRLDSQRLSHFFEGAKTHLAASKEGESNSNLINLDDSELLPLLFDKRLEMLALTIHGLHLGMNEVAMVQNATIQLESAAQRKVLPDNDILRDVIQDYRLFSTRTLTQIKDGLAKSQGFFNGLEHMLPERGKAVYRHVDLPLDLLP